MHLYFLHEIKYDNLIIWVVKITIVSTIQIKYNYHNNRANVCSLRKECQTMDKKQELIQRIENLTDEQFELLIALYFQQEQEFVPDAQFEPPTFLQPSL